MLAIEVCNEVQSLSTFQLLHLPHVWRGHSIATDAIFLRDLDVRVFKKNAC